MSLRLDLFLVEKELVNSRSQAKDFIQRGLITVNGTPQKKPHYKVKENDEVLCSVQDLPVGRGKEKIQDILNEVALDFSNCIVADIGASTGGFTQTSLERGAKKVYAVDVGVGQLHSSLLGDPRVVNLEGINAREDLPFEEKIDIFLVDLSFISLAKVLFNLCSYGHPETSYFCLFKPQFEVGKEYVPKDGIVKNQEAIEMAIKKLRQDCLEHNLVINNFLHSSLVGKKGNQEYFLYLRHADANSKNIPLEDILNLIRKEE